ncbi:hypothetical protein B0A89_13160 [Paracoccus contaminans]|uniref:Uncharacterized protein n=2 Tax=Paracoccus contaminans TaxID=1945662 RepID=A0A1W6CZY3_9RHOB|nr:hypothetical protein B0A89_13160 [Paracoccus contaminans]
MEKKMSFLNSIGKALGGVGKALGGIGQALGGLVDAFRGIMNSPLGSILKTAFPVLGVASGALNLFGMFGNLSNGIGGGQNY